jgi:anti-sigma factor ChrR (cupin superfamily)
MRQVTLLSALLTLAVAAQTGGGSLVMVDPGTAHWEHQQTDPPGAESVILHEDAASGGTEMLVRYPAGHQFAPHWHSANERMVVIEGVMRVEVDGVENNLGPGSYASLPARRLQKETCVSETRCGFYVFWDGKLDFQR